MGASTAIRSAATSRAVHRLFGPNGSQCAAGVGARQITLNDRAIAAGRHAGAGREDNLHRDRPTLARPNAALVRRAAQSCERHARRAAHPRATDAR
jgi:3-keto-5-aminohexanoate cleavage enzyme